MRILLLLALTCGSLAQCGEGVSTTNCGGIMGPQSCECTGGKLWNGNGCTSSVNGNCLCYSPGSTGSCVTPPTPTPPPTATPPPTPPCFSCYTQPTPCYPLSAVCDGVFQCTDTTDEHGCGNESLSFVLKSNWNSKLLMVVKSTPAVPGQGDATVSAYYSDNPGYYHEEFLWKLVPVGANTVVIKSAWNQKILQVSTNPADSSSVAYYVETRAFWRDEFLWTIIPVAGGKVVIKSTYNNHLLQVHVENTASTMGNPDVWNYYVDDPGYHRDEFLWVIVPVETAGPTSAPTAAPTKKATSSAAALVLRWSFVLLSFGIMEG